MPEGPDPSPGRVALVTGATRGIGRALAAGFGAAGYRVAVLGRSAAALEAVAAEVLTTGAAGALTLVADVTDLAAVTAAAEQVETAWGGVDVLVNNAGVIDPVEVPVWEADPDDWWHVVQTDLRGPFHCVRAVVPGMLRRGGGRVVSLNSGAGATDREIYSAYCAAKAGLFRITGNLHLAGFEQGLRSFEVSPGTVRTQMTAGMPMHADRTEWTAMADLVDLVLAAADGRLDPWSGCFLRAGIDTVDGLLAVAARLGQGEPPRVPAPSRRLLVTPWGDDDPLR